MSCLLESLQDKRVRLQPECKRRLQDRIDMWNYAAKVLLHWYLLVSTGIYWYLLVSTGLYWYLLVSTGIYWSLLVAPADGLSDLAMQVMASPSKTYLLASISVGVAVLFALGLLCGRITKRVTQQLKDR
ncbi:Golgi apparatus protein 1 [Merluccius polli]|uniref:Golgi apparatus protein 1 n=1 Tax=Merluccius polli TaxID=89951 RepID=A0AA47MLI8_MERPO|nr:Golgi apparatus protein 1 [Merluccius polli]